MRPEPSELQPLVRELHRQASPWLPSGLGSRLDWGAPVAEGVPVLSTARLDRIVEHCSGDFTVSVEAGVPLRQLQEELARQRQWLAVDWPWGCDPPEGSGSVGGLVARGLAGGYRQRYLGVRDQVIGLTLMRSDGVVAQAGGRVVKNVAGYDLMRLFCGSWGSLGLITAVTLRTMPLPPLRRGLLVQGPLPQLADLARLLRGSSLMPERSDWWSTALVRQQAATAAGGAAAIEAAPALLIALASVDDDALEDQLSWLRRQTPLPARPLDAEPLEALLHSARGGSAAQAPGWLLRLGVRPDRLDTLLARPELGGACGEFNAGSGLGLAWADAAGLSAEAVLSLRQHCRQLGGQLTLLRQPAGQAVPAWEDAPSRRMIEAVKASFDPLGQLAPGRLPGVHPQAALAGARAAAQPSVTR